jgi:hypothetical protein
LIGEENGRIFCKGCVTSVLKTVGRVGQAEGFDLGLALLMPILLMSVLP